VTGDQNSAEEGLSESVAQAASVRKARWAVLLFALAAEVSYAVHGGAANPSLHQEHIAGYRLFRVFGSDPALRTRLARRYASTIFIAHVISPEAEKAIPPEAMPTGFDEACYFAERAMAGFLGLASLNGVPHEVLLAGCGKRDVAT
jgi:hypothetical protein